MNKLHGTIRAALSVLVVALVAIGVPLLVAGPASAHTPNFSKTCYEIKVWGDYYDSYDTNTLGIKIDSGPWTTKTFDHSGTLTAALPQDGQVHAYEAYVHTSNSNPAYKLDVSGTVRSCGTTHVTAVLWNKTDPTCSADGALVKKTEPAGVKVDQSPSGTGPGHYTLTFSALQGYTLDGPNSQVIDVLPKLTGDQCATSVQPVTPTIANPVCTGPGTGTPGSITLPPEGGPISYSTSGNLVIAEADATHKFVTVPSGWTLVDSHHATYAVTFTEPAGYPECLVELPAPVSPTVTQAECTGPGTHSDPVVTLPDVEGDHLQYAYDEDTQVVTATPAAGYVLGDLAEGWVMGDGVATYLVTLVDPGPCLVDAAVASPSVTQSVCTGNGTKSNPVVTLGDLEGDHVAYVYDAGTRVVTASPDPGYTLAGLPAGWVLGESGKATYQVVLTDPGTCVIEVSPPTVPGHTPVPAALPNTGGPSGWLAVAGGAMVLGGLVLLGGRRRRTAEGVQH